MKKILYLVVLIMWFTPFAVGATGNGLTNTPRPPYKSTGVIVTPKPKPEEKPVIETKVIYIPVENVSYETVIHETQVENVPTLRIMSENPTIRESLIIDNPHCGLSPEKPINWFDRFKYLIGI